MRSHLRRSGARRACGAGALLAVLALGAPPTRAQTGVDAAPASAATAQAAAVDDAAVADVARSLNCPICEGRNLIDCPLPVCAEMRAEIRGRLAVGEERDAIIAHFVAYYGPRVRNTPPLSGPLALAWWVPIVAFGLGAVVVAGLTRRRGPHADAAPGPAPDTAGPSSGDAPPIDYAAVLERMAHEREVDE